VRADGFRPLADYSVIAGREGYGALFLQREQENARSYAKLPHSLYADRTSTSNAWRALDRILQLAQARDIEVHLVIYPYHAHLLEIFRAYGLWPLFEEWKRALVRKVGADRAAAGWSPALWDFSGYDQYTTERVPPLGDKSSQVHWYWEAGHFKRELGELVLARVFGGGGSFG
jgi:hypothetical protein